MNLRTETADHALGRSRGGLGTKIHQPSDGNGYPPGAADRTVSGGRFAIVCGVDGRVVGATSRVRATQNPSECSPVLGDRAYSSRTNREHLGSRGGSRRSSPSRTTRNATAVAGGSRGGRPVGVDQEKYMGCNVVERSFCAIEQWCGSTACYDKLALAYRAGVMLSVCTWLRHLTNQETCCSAGCCGGIRGGHGPRGATPRTPACRTGASSRRPIEPRAPYAGRWLWK
jgi:putative transposase